MTDRVRTFRRMFVEEKIQESVRQAPLDANCLAEDFARQGMMPLERATRRLCYVLAQEKPVLFEGEKIAFTRTVPVIPEIFTEDEMDAIKLTHWIHEKGDVCNVCVDYTLLLSCGFEQRKAQLEKTRKEFLSKGQLEQAAYINAQIRTLDAVQDLADRYRELAREQGNTVVAWTLEQVPAKAPRNFLEALQMFRIIHFAMWCGRNYHNTVGRFDQYMYPYYRRDLESGLLTEETALELLEEFFLTFNRDSDLYPGMQQGDNGQSMVLGGKDPNGRDCFNDLSRLCMEASCELKLIDPKINLRVHRDTPLEQYILGTQMTKQGLGFPQYSNDEVVIPGLLKLGYREQDAYNYVVAACWEFIIPGNAMDIPNIDALSFAQCVEDAVFEDLERCSGYDAFAQAVKRQIQAQADAICQRHKNVYIFPAPFVSLMIDGCTQRGQDVSQGALYNNYGIHGTGLATAADSMAAVKKYVFDERSVTAGDMVAALKSNFEGYEQLRRELRYETPKMGNDDDFVDNMAVELLDWFADSLEEKKNDRGGCYRAGTGSAMYYIWHAKELSATPDGRMAGEGLGCNYSPSLYSRSKGPISVIHSFTKPHLSRVINGGPLTIELHDTVFRNEQSIPKVATMIKSYFDLGGHQLQINAVNRETMLDAQKHPEKYRNLIVRVWGWSGYFVELDKVYQDHIIQRMEMQV